MFSPDDIQGRLRGRPFSPTRIVTTTGQTYDIYHPDLVLVGRTFVIIGIPSREKPTQAEQVTQVALMHITELRDLPVPVIPPGNSQD
jgi:hypothetical protein